MQEIRFGDWISESEIGHGTWGIVYQVAHVDDPSKRMAVKWLTDPRAKEPSFHVRFQAEMAVLRRLDHPNIVKFFDHGLHENSPFVVMDFIEGETFEKRLQQGHKFLWPEVLSIAMQIVSAMRYAHRRGILHRSLKPSNLYQTSDGMIKISDFGLSKLFNDSLQGNQPANLNASIFASPEQLMGKPLSKRSDFFTLGTVLYTMLVGRPPFVGTSLAELVQKICYTLPERPINYLPDLPEEVDYLIGKLLTKDPAQRPGSGTLLFAELERIWSDLERRKRIGKKPELPSSGSDNDVNLEQEIEEEVWTYTPARHSSSKLQQGLLLTIGLLLIGGILTWAFFIRGESAEELYEQAQPLVQSTQPDDWEKAWDQYYSRLAAKYPDRYATEVRRLKSRVDLIREFRLGLAAARRRQISSDAERFYYEGFRLCQAGNFDGAKRIWTNLLAVFQGSEKDQFWIDATHLALKRTEELQEESEDKKLANQRSLETFLERLQHLEELQQSGKHDQAKALKIGLLELYRDQPFLKQYEDRLK